METVLEGELPGNQSAETQPSPADARRTQTRLAYSTNIIKLYPGDQCVLLRSESDDNDMQTRKEDCTEPTTTQHCMFVGSLVRQGLGLSAERLIWVDVENEGQDRGTMRYVGASNVTNLPTWVRGRHGTPHNTY